MHMNANEHIGDDGTEMFQSWNKYDWMGVGIIYSPVLDMMIANNPWLVWKLLQP